MTATMEGLVSQKEALEAQLAGEQACQADLTAAKSGAEAGLAAAQAAHRACQEKLEAAEV